MDNSDGSGKQSIASELTDAVSNVLKTEEQKEAERIAAIQKHNAQLRAQISEYNEEIAKINGLSTTIENSKGELSTCSTELNIVADFVERGLINGGIPGDNGKIRDRALEISKCSIQADNIIGLLSNRISILNELIAECEAQIIPL